MTTYAGTTEIQLIHQRSSNHLDGDAAALG